MSGAVRLDLVWAADIENHTAGWAGSRIFGPSLTPDGDVLVGGSLKETWSLFGEAPLTTVGDDIVSARLGGDTGTPLWTKHFANDASEFGVTALGSADTLLVHGSFLNSLDVGGEAPLEGDPDPAIDNADTHFFAAYDGQGELTWSSILAHRNGTLFLPEVAWHEQGGIGLAALGSWAQITLGENVYEPVLGSILVARLDPQGACVWSVQSIPETFGSFTGTNDLAVNETGRLFVTGNHQGRATLGGNLLDSGDAKAALLLAFEPSGDLAWHQLILAPNEPPALRIALTGDDIVVYGTGASPLDFGEGPRGSDSLSGFIARYRPDGSLRWSRALGGEGMDGLTIASAPGNDTLVAGRFTGALDAGSEVLTSAGRNDAFVARLDDTGQTIWAVRMGDEWDQGVDEIEENAAGDLFLRTGPIASSGPGSGSIVFSRWRVVQE